MHRRCHIFVSTVLVLLLVTVSMRFIIFSSCIKVQKRQFRYEALLKVNTGIIILQMPISQLYEDNGTLEWKEQNQELTINGKYHEVIKVEKMGKTARIFLIEDEQESQLFAQFFRLKNDQQKNFSVLTAFLFGLHFSEPLLYCFTQPGTEGQTKNLHCQTGYPAGFHNASERPPTFPRSTLS